MQGEKILTSSRAPFIYFDGVPAYGTLHGAVRMELAAAVIHPTDDGGTRTEIVPTAHIRCSPAAARELMLSLQKALDMFDDPPQSPDSLN